MRQSRCLVVLLQFLFAVTLYAGENPKGDFALNIWGRSYHLGAASPGYLFNEKNFGVGVRYYFPEPILKGEMFADVNAFRNSTSGTTFSLAAGYQKPIWTRGQTTLLVGAVGGVMQYENHWKNKIFLRPAGYPFLGLQHKKTMLVVGFLPGDPGVLFAYASIRF